MFRKIESRGISGQGAPAVCLTSFPPRAIPGWHNTAFREAATAPRQKVDPVFSSVQSRGNENCYGESGTLSRHSDCQIDRRAVSQERLQVANVNLFFLSCIGVPSVYEESLQQRSLCASMDFLHAGMKAKRLAEKCAPHRRVPQLSGHHRSDRVDAIDSTTTWVFDNRSLHVDRISFTQAFQLSRRRLKS